MPTIHPQEKADTTIPLAANPLEPSMVMAGRDVLRRLANDLGAHHDGDGTPVRRPLSHLHLTELLLEIQDRVDQIVRGRDRLDGLVEAMLVVTSDWTSTRRCGQSCTRQ